MYIAPDLLNASSTSAHHPAVLDPTGGATSYEDLRDQARRCATYIARRTTPGDRVAILLPRGAEALAVFFGAHLACCIAVIVSDRLRPRQVARLLQHCDARLVLTDRAHEHLLQGISASLADSTTVVDVTAIREAPLRSSIRPTSKDIAALIYTSGSTGTPKGVAVTHRNLVAGASIVTDYLQMRGSDRTLALLPWNFDYGLNQALSTFAAGGTLVIQRSARASDITRTLSATNVSLMAGTPTVWNLLTGEGSPFLTRDLPRLRCLTNSGGPLSQPTLNALRGRAHTTLVPMYGLTEAFRSTYLDPHVEPAPDLLGRAIPDTTLLVLDEAGQICRPGAVGELIHHGPTVAAGYWNDPEATASTFRPHPFPQPGLAPETVVYSGDYVRCDERGLLYYAGRRDEMFKSQGIRTNPAEIETEILASELAKTVVVTTTPGADTGQTSILAAVEPVSQKISRDDIRSYCRRELPAHQHPHLIVLMSQMPVTANGKTDRAQVKALLASAHEPTVAS